MDEQHKESKRREHKSSEYRERLLERMITLPYNEAFPRKLVEFTTKYDETSRRYIFECKCGTTVSSTRPTQVMPELRVFLKNSHHYPDFVRGNCPQCNCQHTLYLVDHILPALQATYGKDALDRRATEYFKGLTATEQQSLSVYSPRLTLVNSDCLQFSCPYKAHWIPKSVSLDKARSDKSEKEDG